MQFTLIHRSLNLVVPLAWIGVVVNCAVFISFYIEVEPVYFPPPSHQMGTHPLTAVMFGLIASSLVFWRPYSVKKISILFSAIAALIALVRIIDFAFTSQLLDLITPYKQLLEAHANQGRVIKIPFIVALTGVLMPLSIVLVKHFVRLSQLFAFVSLAVPVTGFVGITYGIENFIGGMSLTSILLMLPISLAILFSSAHKSHLKILLGPWVTGNIARIQIILGFIFPYLIGLFLIGAAKGNYEQLFVFFVVITGFFIIVLVSFSSIIYEKIDQRRRLIERNFEFATIEDLLTGLPNKRYFDDHGKWLIEASIRSSSPMSVLILDIDLFAKINEHYDNQAGDNVLRTTADICSSMLRKQDFVARFEDDAFVVLLPDTGLNGAVKLADKLREVISNWPYMENEQITVSIGCAVLKYGEQLESLLGRADLSLYKAKEMGGNQVISEFDNSHSFSI